MKMKALLLACAAAGAFASIALADGGHHGRHHKHGTTTTASTGTTTTAATTTATTTTGATTTTATPANCSRIGLRGTLATVSPTSFTLTITKVENDDEDGAATGPAVGSTVTIAVDANTRVQWDGVGTLIGPNVGDSARVKARSCGSPATFTAKWVKARSAHTAHDDSHHDSKSHK